MSWETGLEIVSCCPELKQKVRVFVPLSVLELCRLLEQYVGSNEFLIYCSVHEGPDYILLSDPMIPEQVVSPARVEVEKPAADKDAVIHRHPSGVHSFSSTDDQYINANNKVSILYVDGKFSKAVVKRKLPCGRYGFVEGEIYLIVRGRWDSDIEEEYREAREIFESQKDRIKQSTTTETLTKYITCKDVNEEYAEEEMLEDEIDPRQLYDYFFRGGY